MTRLVRSSGWLALVLLASLAWAQAPAQAPAADAPAAPVATPAAADWPPADDATYTTYTQAFDYDTTLPLNATIVSDEDQAGTRVQLIEYDSAQGGRVPGYLLVPPAAGKRPVILLANGLGSSKSMILELAPYLATFGLEFAVFCIDAPEHGPRGEGGGTQFFSLDLERTRRNIVQGVDDYRRALDYIATRDDLDAERVCLAGASLGAILGTMVTALEPARIKTAILAVGGADYGKIIADSQHPAIAALREYAQAALGSANPFDLPELRAQADPLDPLHYAPRLGDRPILVLGAQDDEVIPHSAGQRLAELAVGSPKVVEWYPGGHMLAPDLVLPRLLSWLNEYL